MLRDTLFINDQGHLDVGGADCTELAREFGTPLYVLDEDCIRKVCRDYRRVLDAKYPDSLICYASKAFSAQAIYTIVGQEGCGADVVSAGEMYTAMTAGFDMSKTYFHGSNKLPHEVDMALRAGVHAIVADGESDLELLADAAERTGIRPRVLLRINPGIEAHTHEFVQTTRIDSKFGVSVADGTALALVGKFIESDTMDFLGVHCHIGSQIFELAPFRSAVDKVTDFCVEVKRKLGFDIREINFGGGYGIRYVESDKPYDPSVYVDAIVTKLLECIESKGLRAPHLVLEPGRSIVGEAGITLYTVGAIKTIPNVKKYIGVDGGMFDNPRYALYGSQYTAMLANRASEPAAEKVTIAGKCCESGDMVAADVMLPPARRGDIVAVLSTGAYNYSMASHYNRNAIPPVVLVKDGAAEYIVRPETLEDLIARDVIPSRLKG